MTGDFPCCEHETGKCYDVDERGHLPAVFGDQPPAPFSVDMHEQHDPREAKFS